MKRRQGQNLKRRVGLDDRLQLWISSGRRIDGLWVGSGGDWKWPAMRRVEAALNLIKQYDRLRYDRLIHDLERVWVRLLSGPRASFNPSLRACQLDERFVMAETSSPELIATVIVHEAAHARLMRCGVGYDEPLRARVEAVCFRRERAFAARLPNGEQLREQLEHRTTGYPPDFWSNTAGLDRYDKGAAEALRYLGCPEWLIRVIFVVARLARRLRRVSGA